MKRIACIFNFPSHYRENIYLKMEKEFNCDFYFGDLDGKGIRKVNFKLFQNKVSILKTIKLFANFNWIKGSIRLVFKPYTKYILIGEPYCISTWVFLLFSRLLNKKTYLWTHGWYGDEGLVKKLIKKLFFNLSNGLFLYGNYAKDLMKKKGFNEHKLHVIYNSLDYESQLEIRKKLKVTDIFKTHFKNEYPTIVFIGRLTKVKKLHQIIEAQKLLKNKGKPVNVVFLGDGVEKENLSQLTEKLDLIKNVWFYGTCYNECEIGNLIYNADICVSPGNIGLTAMHVLMYGTPIVTHNNFPNQMPEFEAIEDGVTGVFFMEDNIDDLVNKIEILLLDINNGKIKSENCYKKIDKYFNPNYQIKMLREVLL